MSLKQRSLVLLHTTRFVTFATLSPENTPWAATVEPKILFNPLRFLWYSAHQNLHSQNIRHHAQVSGTLFNYHLPEFGSVGFDGAQFLGTARELSVEESTDAYREFHQNSLFNETQNTLPSITLEQLQGGGHSRFYEFIVDQWWLFDMTYWLANQESRCIPVPLSYLNDE
ncbi:pyridoxamine 5'-phosphate oxidase family protein [Providencia alcalifaciens]|uniref:pyridoxamine 5'-phosphate oxidase family protein n=1 Tax=Providencia alcalifaciens TaxID=126385 RepID=UPI001CE039BB|nr:pyridoxamine 5'-phosphate oxidase family protein [Providencia alcalifaciens]UBX50709.1 pyridoxamine 5'-phosphate oxidase family protein [Providencia alcalifaciens]